jgi:hypothetical protein
MEKYFHLFKLKFWRRVGMSGGLVNTITNHGKESHKRPGVAQRVPGGLGSQFP